ncbi:MAG TPA: DUF4097 family beta strand repeat-containing protein [Actinopolymorphaceae bacterium]
MPTFSTPEPITLRVKISGGQVVVEASDRADTEVTVLPGDPSRSGDVEAAEATIVEHRDGVVVVEAPEVHGGRWFSTRSHDVRVHVALPQDSDARIETASADVRVSGRLADAAVTTASGNVGIDQVKDLAVKTASGDVQARAVAGDGSLTTASGNVTVPSVGGSVRVSAASGDIELGTVGGDVELKSASGDAAVRSVGGSLEASSASGDVSIGAVTRGRTSVNTASGDIRVGITEGTTAWLELNTLSGDVRSDLDGTDDPGSGETVEIRASSLSGDIRIVRAH